MKQKLILEPVFYDLSKDEIYYIFSYLDIKTVCVLQQVNSHFDFLASSNQLWKELLAREDVQQKINSYTKKAIYNKLVELPDFDRIRNRDVGYRDFTQGLLTENSLDIDLPATLDKLQSLRRSKHFGDGWQLYDALIKTLSKANAFNFRPIYETKSVEYKQSSFDKLAADCCKLTFFGPIAAASSTALIASLLESYAGYSQAKDLSDFAQNNQLALACLVIAALISGISLTIFCNTCCGKKKREPIVNLFTHYPIREDLEDFQKEVSDDAGTLSLQPVKYGR